MDFLNWAEMSPLGEWVSTSLWGYPIALTLHTIGMGTLVGLALMICFRVLGVGRGIQTSRLPVYWKLALIGFAINLFSGVALFFGSATVLWESWPFRIKIVFILAGLVGTHFLVRSCAVTRRVISAKNVSLGLVALGRISAGGSTVRQKVLAFAVILIWMTALVAGRLIAYIF
ncbi:hypothetical protein EBI01_01685 [Marinomonas rhizomae]|uniref:Copper resistance protein D n=1 Tax=Marinomonas rhizomae TaxID=491948 RepID=A0A366JHJ9_9GAMM|nr:hypothetical protein [Marinomonas rhizomae]RBP85814.1 hypothetical protein DFP80_101309 [Marinomonas rhizomae]RNF75569.1 hypothetical protein EBI01_01685 [Marinomonas rhizomae]